MPEPALLEGLNDDQVESVQLIASRFGCWPDDIERLPALFSDPTLIEFVIGERKGRPLVFGVDPAGRTHT
jgi:hypothetical protein